MKYLEKNWIYVFMFFVLLGCIFGGCDLAPNDSQYFVIDRIKKQDSECQYSTVQGWKFTAYCGKFNIGDTVYVNYFKNEHN